MTLLNALIVFVLVAGVAWLCASAPVLGHLIHPRKEASVQAGFGSERMDFRGQVYITNKGDREMEVVAIWVMFTDEHNERKACMADSRTWGGPFKIPAEDHGMRWVELGGCPGTLKDPVTRVNLMYYDGTTEQLVDSTRMSVTCSGARPAPSPADGGSTP